MKIEPGKNLPRIKITNQAAIRRIVYLYGPIARLEIAKSLNLTLPTITTNISNMISCGIIQERENTGNVTKTMGRKSNPVDINPESRYFIGVEIRRKVRHVCLTDYRGKVISSTQDNTFYESYEDTIESAGSMIKHLLSIEGKKIYGIGICMPGIIDKINGKLKVQLQYNWHDKNVCGDIKKNTGYSGPVVIENDACARAVGVSLFNKALLKDYHSFAYLYVTDGISCPFLINDTNFVSFSVGPGELGYMIMDPNKPDNELGSTGRLSEFSGDRVVTELCVKAAQSGKSTHLAKVLAASGKIHMNDILQAQSEGEIVVSEIVSEAARYLGIAIANIDNFVRPDCFLMEANLFKNEQNRRLFLETVNKNAFRPAADTPHFTFIAPDILNGAKGAAAVAIQNDLGTYIG